MSKCRRNLTSIILLLLTIGFAKSGSAQTISPYLFGVNAWMPDTIGDYHNCQDPPCLKNGKLHKQWQKVGDSKAGIVRYGGIAPDRNIPTMYQYLRMVDSIRAHGMEPMLQVPFYNYRYTAQDAANIVQYINVTKGRNVKYWIIANEPNLIYNYTTAGQIAAYFKQFASAMKAVDPSIKIVGPETASFKQTITNGLTTPGGADDITGKDQNGNYYLDVFTFHTYPFGNGSTSTRAALIAELMLPGNFHDDLLYVKNRLASCNTFHNRTGSNSLTMGVTEASVNYTNPTNDNLYGFGTYSFLGAQFVAEMYGIGMKTGVNFINLWSVIEGNSLTENCGYIDQYTQKKRPLYYHFQMIAENFKGNNVNCTLNQPNLKSFASKDANEICVLIMNEDASVNHNYTVRLNTAAITGTSTAKINANANVAAQYTDVIQNQSSVMLVFNHNGTLLRKCEYTLANHAAADLPPTCTVYGTTSVGSAFQPGTGNLDFNLFPNPTDGKFTVELSNTGNSLEPYYLDVINIVGQLVMSKKITPENGRENVDMETGFANGVYIVRLRQGETFVAKRVVLQ